jgi:hypothetical protein
LYEATKFDSVGVLVKKPLPQKIPQQTNQIRPHKFPLFSCI